MESNVAENIDPLVDHIQYERHVLAQRLRQVRKSGQRITRIDQVVKHPELMVPPRPNCPQSLRAYVDRVLVGVLRHQNQSGNKSTTVQNGFNDRVLNLAIAANMVLSRFQQ